MGCYRSRAGLFVAVLLGMLPGLPAPPAAAQGKGALASRTVHGKVEMINESVNGIAVISDDGQRMAWRFDASVIADLAQFKPGDPVPSSSTGSSGARTRGSLRWHSRHGGDSTYINKTGSRVVLRSAPMVNGVCGQPDAGPVSESNIPQESRRGHGGVLVLRALGATPASPRTSRDSGGPF